MPDAVNVLIPKSRPLAALPPLAYTSTQLSSAALYTTEHTLPPTISADRNALSPRLNSGLGINPFGANVLAPVLALPAVKRSAKPSFNTLTAGT
jgi:hypothetical protein